MTTDTRAADGKHRFQALDGLRGVAAVLVVLLHVEWSNHLTENNFVQHGYVAVDLFFILSGFVISANYLNRINDFTEAKRFVALRFFRLYPLHVALLSAFVCLEAAKLAAHHAFGISLGPQAPFTGDNSMGALAANFFLVNGLHVLNGPSWNGVSWSISCEFAAYLVFGVTVLTGMVRKRLFFVTGFLLAAACYAGMVVERGNLNITADWGIVRCLSGFFLGMLIYRFRGMSMFRRSSAVIGQSGVAVIATTIVAMSFASSLVSFLVIPLFVIVIALLQFDKGIVARILISPTAQFLGRISYSIYMVHSFVVVCLLIILKRAFVLRSVIYPMRENPILMVNPWIGDLLVLGIVAGVVAAASMTYALIEEPGRRFGRRLLTSHKNQTSALLSPVTVGRISTEKVQSATD